MLHYLKSSLSPPIVIRFANKMAEIAENQFDNCLMASRLYLKSGNLEKAYTITFDAANNLININSFDSSLKILFSLEKLCLRYDDIDKLKSVLMKIGDIEKLIGEAVQAEKAYLRIVKLYDNQPTDRLLAETYKDLGDLYKMKQQYEDGIDALRKAEKIYSAVGDELELSHTLNNIGNIQTIISQYDEALRNYRHALKIQRKLNIASDVASTLNNMAAIYYYRGAYTRTLRLFGMAASIQRQTGNAGELARSLNNLGCVYHEFGNFNKALDYLGESVILNRRIGSKKEILFNLENLSSVMLSAGRLRESIKYLKEGLQLSKELSDIPHMAIFTCNMAVAQKRMGFYGQALENINEAIKLHDEINNNQHLLICLIETADMHLRLNNFDSAHAFIGKIINLAGAVDDKKALISGYLLKGLAENNTRYINQAINLAEENKASRIKTIGRLRLAKVLLAGGDYQGSLNILNGLLNVFNEQSSDIEAADFFNLFGACYLAAGQVDKAERFFEKGIVLAKNMALLPELINSAFNLGKINAHYKAHETVYNYYRLAAEKLKIMVEDIKDELLKKSFLSTGNITSMAKEIRKLNELLITK
jgi:tetratricopeptide (TPR) repeat protein